MSHVCPHELCSPACDASTCAGAWLVSADKGNGQNFSVSNEIQGTSHRGVGSFGPLSSGAIPQWHPADRRSHASTRYRELEPLPEGLVRRRRHRRSIPLCATFPTSRGD